MRRRSSIPFAAVLLLCACPPPVTTAVDSGSGPDAGPGVTAVGCDDCRVLVGGRYFDGSQRVAGTVVLRGSKIDSLVSGEVEVVAGQRVDLAGKTVLPGLIDLHAHVFSTWSPNETELPQDRWEPALKALLRAGVTTIADLQSPRGVAMELRSRVASGQLLGPRIFAAGPKFALTGESTCPVGMPPLDWCVTFDTVQQARDQVRALVPLRPDFIKIALSSGGRMTTPMVAAIVEEAELEEITVIAHVGDAEDTAIAFEGGVRAFAHSPMLSALPADLIQRMGQARVVVVPTAAVQDASYRRALGTFKDMLGPDAALDIAPGLLEELRNEKGRPQLIPSRQKALERAISNLIALQQAGAIIATGTDSGVYGSLFGRAMARELELYVEAGMLPVDALLAATRNPADLLKRPDLGRIAPGAVADLLIVEGDPLTDIRAIRQVHQVFLGGDPLDREALEIPRDISLAKRSQALKGDGATCLLEHECSPGLVCSLRSVCRAGCSAPTDCGPKTSCSPESPTSGACWPTEGCDPLKQDCANRAACIFAMNDSTFCWFAGSGTEGASCASTGLCAPGFQCEPAQALCRRICDPVKPSCSAGKACIDYSGFAGRSIGLCAP